VSEVRHSAFVRSALFEALREQLEPGADRTLTRCKSLDEVRGPGVLLIDMALLHDPGAAPQLAALRDHRWRSDLEVLALATVPATDPLATFQWADGILDWPTKTPLHAHLAVARARLTRRLQTASLGRSYEISAHLAHDAIEICTADFRLIDVNPTFEAVTGWNRKDALGKTPGELLRSDLHDAEFYAAMEKTLLRGETWRGNYLGRRKNGVPYSQATTIRPVCHPVSGELEHLVAIKSDRSQLELATGGYQALMESTSDAVFLCRSGTREILEVNAGACTLFRQPLEVLKSLRLDDLLGQDATGLVFSESNDDTAPSESIRDLCISRADGSDFWIDVRVGTYVAAGSLFTVAIVRDISENVQREQQLATSLEALQTATSQLTHAAKLAAIGQLAAGVAHEVNNPANFIMLNLVRIQNLIRRREWLDPEMIQCVADCQEGMDRIRAITRDLRTFSRIEQDRRHALDLNTVIASSVRMLNTEIRHRAKLELELGEVSSILGDRPKLSQVITNLVVNAVQAIEEGQASHNTIRITTRSSSQGTDERRGVELRVEDSGSGISPELRDQVFDPFFTTKARDVGTGLGLSVCAEIVRAHDGTIDFVSEVGQGTCFRLWFPCVESSAAIREQRHREDSTPSRRARVLVIDDDVQVLEAFYYVLETRHDVTLADGGEAALAILNKDTDFDVILCDIMMPDVDGIAVCEAVNEDHPHLADRFLFCSGGVFTPRARDFFAGIEASILEKPATATELRNAVRSVFEGRKYQATTIRP